MQILKLILATFYVIFNILLVPAPMNLVLMSPKNQPFQTNSEEI